MKIKDKRLAEKINIKGFQASDGWFDRWKNSYNISFKTVSGEGNSYTAEMTAPLKQKLSPRFCPSTNMMKFTMQMNYLSCFSVCKLKSHSIFDLMPTKTFLTGMTAVNAMHDKKLLS